MYNGQTIVNLKDNKISDTVWEAHVTNLSSIIYDEQESMAFVVKNMSNNGDAYMVDLRKGNFTLIKNFVNKKFFNNFDIFEAYYAGFEFGRITRIFLKLYFKIAFIAHIARSLNIQNPEPISL